MDLLNAFFVYYGTSGEEDFQRRLMPVARTFALDENGHAYLYTSVDINLWDLTPEDAVKEITDASAGLVEARINIEADENGKLTQNIGGYRLVKDIPGMDEDEIRKLVLESVTADSLYRASPTSAALYEKLTSQQAS